MPNFFDWRTRKKLAYLFAGLVIVAGFIFLVIYFALPSPSCFDGMKNGGEEGIDCGGSCSPCVFNPKDVIVLWTRVMPGFKEKQHEAASLIENPNLFYGLPLFKYTFKLYDERNILVAVKEGQTYLNPREKFVVFATGIETGERVPVRAYLEIESLSEWRYLDKEKTPLVVTSTDFRNYPFPLFTAKLFNESLFPVKDVNAAAVLYDENDNAFAVSSTRLDIVSAEAEAAAVFTWPAPFAKEPIKTEIFARTNLISAD